MSLRSRIVLAVAAVFAVVSGVAGGLMLNQTEQSLITAFDRATQTRANWLLSLVSLDPVVLPLPTIDEQMQVTATTYGHTRELFRSPGFPNTSGPVPLHRTLPGTVQPMPASYRLVSVVSSVDQLPAGDRLTLTLAVPDGSLQRDIRQLRWVFGLGWGLSLLLALGAGYGAAGWLLRPIKNLVAQASRVGQATRIDPLDLPRSRDELYVLTVALNQMLDRIRYNIDTQRHFFGAAAHELRTPLAVMKTGLEVTMNTGQVDPAMQPFLSGQLDEIRRLTRLIDELLTLSRPTEALPTLHKTEVPIAGRVAYCLAQLTTVATDYDVTTQLIAEGLADPVLETDVVKFDQVLLNLIENAIKYAVENSTVTVSISSNAVDGVVIRIQNRTLRESGPTLDLLEPYFQEDPLKEGHGLGLWISNRLSVLLGGQLYLYWQHFVFTSEIRLPLSERKW